jgi:hypothetical protein
MLHGFFLCDIRKLCLFGRGKKIIMNYEFGICNVKLVDYADVELLNH